MEKKSGEGTWTFPGGDFVKGFFKEDELVEGMYVSNGFEYRGGFLDFKMHGKGKLEFKDGKVYEGDFKEGLMTGEGELVNGNKIYKGGFRRGKQHGIGVYLPTGKNGQGYRGRWRNGKRIEWMD